MVSAPLITVNYEKCGKDFFFIMHGMPHTGICGRKAGHDGDCWFGDEYIVESSDD